MGRIALMPIQPRLQNGFSAWMPGLGLILALALGLSLASLALPVRSEEIPAECKEESDMSPQQMDNMCLGYKLRAMEADVAKAYERQLAVEQAANYSDAATQKTIIDAFIASQTAFEAYRTNECNSEGYMAIGGSLESQLYGECMVRLLTARMAELKMLSEGLGN
jgi:uncharacterized protein YecT (DUF1311 family)